ncbi:UNVERIFIED_CONTAM: hypothetical protein GTU68_002846 [Idotea baltica]|nr:hypothetical protein [Idotea baltica]
MGIRTIAVFSDADENANFVKQADTAIYIGESEPSKSYLRQDKIIEAAKIAKANAIHPGFGFLAENANFAQLCLDNELIFIGPPVEAINAMGSKAKAKEIMQKADVPCVPGYQGNNQSTQKLTAEAVKIGFPILLKATAGGGGKGMRIVRNESELENAITSAKSEAKNAFGNDELIIEKYIESGRHIEFQIIGDEHGNIIHLLERECTIQRRYQKVIEESPSPVLSEKLRQEMGEISVQAGKAINYTNAGTVEYILAEKENGEHDFYFLEMNTRLQVEHPVTEEITGVDLVQLQIEIAEGKPLTIQQENVKGCGYAIECRLYAEDAANNFTPVTGNVLNWVVPEMDGLRIETDISSGAEVSIYYDPMIAKVITHGANRAEAQRKMTYALQHLTCLGTTTNQDFLIHILQNKDFKLGNYDTHFIELLDLTLLTKTNNEIACIAATLYGWNERNNQRTLLKTMPSGWRNNCYQKQFETWNIADEALKIQYRYNNNIFNFEAGENEYIISNLRVNGGEISFQINEQLTNFTIVNNKDNYYLHSSEFGNYILTKIDRFPEKETEKVKGGYTAKMPSQILKIHVAEGQEVKEGDKLLVSTSMKMENTLYADEAGTVTAIYVAEGENVEAGATLLQLSVEN